MHASQSLYREHYTVLIHLRDLKKIRVITISRNGKISDCMHVCICISGLYEWFVPHYYGLAVASPYVGMARFQDGGPNQCISVFMTISSPRNKY